MPIEIKVPSVGESISEVEIGRWLKQPGDAVREGENLVILESEKATVDFPAPSAGVLSRILKPTGEVAAVGEVIAEIDPAGATSPDAPSITPTATPTATPTNAAVAPAPGTVSAATSTPGSAPPKIMPAANRILASAGVAAAEVPGTGPGGRILKEDALKAVESHRTAPPTPPPATPTVPPALPPTVPPVLPPALPPVAPEPDRLEESVRMSKLRRTVAARLVTAKSEMALLTTFNEIDMSAVVALRKDLQESFTAKHGVKLGFMSFFVRAAIDALKLVPALNAEIRGENLVYKYHYDIGVAIGGGKGLVVPVLRHAEQLGFADIERAIAGLAALARDGKLMPDDLAGGTFTLTNGGVYGSLLSTPIVNPPQSGVLGMHTIQERPIALNGQVVIRPMMYVALTYDHRIVDGREAVLFLKRIKEAVENPVRLLLEV